MGKDSRSRAFYQGIKSGVDSFCALVVLVLTLPVSMLVGVFLALSVKGSPFFTQVRPGKDAKLFTLIKFKTMDDATDASGHLLADEKRLTWVGKFVRKTSLDELPQLINVLKGDMSLVGPRPLLEEYLPLYSAYQARRHEVKPGISGWAQVNGRNAISWERKFELDIWYVDNQSFWLDVKIVFLTLAKILKAEGISGEGTVTMKKFTGSLQSEKNQTL
jgi:undecaprenyl phosphate N,N'-diacetylbacillosamine 1-phosphate transferase